MTERTKRSLVDLLVGPKREWRAYKRRVRALPLPYREAVAAVETYLMHFGPEDWSSSSALLGDVADLFEQAASDGTSIRAVVGEDPVEFADALIRNYDKSGYVARQQRRLTDAIARAESLE